MRDGIIKTLANSQLAPAMSRMKRVGANFVPRAGAALAASLCLRGQAFAQEAGGVDPSTILMNISNFILGPFGQSLAVLGIVAVGLSWMFGRASLGLVAGVVGGIVIMFGASFLGMTLTGG